jgi:superfamily II DNA helicase RecQ
MGQNSNEQLISSAASNHIILMQTGAGKTLAMTVPTYLALKQAEQVTLVITLYVALRYDLLQRHTKMGFWNLGV